MNASELSGMAEKLSSLTVYRRLLHQPVTGALCELLRAACRSHRPRLCSSYGKLCSALLATPSPHSLLNGIAGEVLADLNPFTVCCAAGKTPDPILREMARRDLSVLSEAGSLCREDIGDLPQGEEYPPWCTDTAPSPLDSEDWGDDLAALSDAHRRGGCGPFFTHRAFLWRKGALTPIEHPDPIALRDLKEYAAQRQIAVRNTEAFLNGLPANNLLLYGDRGTGKSSTVKALLNAYADRGLRMIEVPKESLGELPDLTDRLARLPMRFILFIDDLSFASGDDSFASLKAVLEGGLASRPENVLLYATSNRRHLLKETFSDREGDDIHRADTVQESVSLSDRFGITLTFLLPDKEHFASIVAQMADDCSLAVDRDKLLDAAERWALRRGGRSPRYAKQFLLDVQSRLAQGESLPY